ncbi:MAG: polysaccharide deacetylase family protein [Firmicutes bacterium]|nr:polysaccharide deacetylase family protein [Bacillota bacterium]
MKGKRIWWYRLIAALCFIIAAPGLAYGAESGGEPEDGATLAPYFFIKGGDQSAVDSLPLKATNVTANINGVIADIYVKQTYANPEGKSTGVNQPLPLPQGVSDFAVGGGYDVGAEPGWPVLAAGSLFMLLLVVLYRLLKRSRQAFIFIPASKKNSIRSALLLRMLSGAMLLLAICCYLYCFPTHVYPMSGLYKNAGAEAGRKSDNTLQQEFNKPGQPGDAKTIAPQDIPPAVAGQSGAGPAANPPAAVKKEPDQTTSQVDSDKQTAAPVPPVKPASATDNQLVDKVAGANNLVALTFDDGPYPQMTGQYLAVLRKYNVRATFFMVGQRIKDYPELACQVVEQGSEIGSHAWAHARLDKMTGADMSNDLALVNSQVQTAAGQPVTLLRPPYGRYSEALLTAAKQQGYRVILWDVDPRDWENPAPAKIVANIQKNVQPGSIIVLHEGHPNTLQALPLVIENLRQQGLEPVTVSEMLNGQSKQPESSLSTVAAA